MIKKLLILLGLSCTFGAQAVDFICDYNTAQRTAVITGWYDDGYDAADLYIPIEIIFTGNNARYSIVGIRSNALNGLKGVKRVHIPSNVGVIGGVSDSRYSHTNSLVSIDNFLDCPDIEAFIVAEGNPTFSSTNGGMLMLKDKTILYRVPPRMAVTDGSLGLPSGCERIARNAFDGNTTISTIRFSKSLKYVNPNPGFHTMKQIAEYVVPSVNTNFEVDNGALINTQTKTVVSLPRFWQGSPTYSLSLSKADKIAAYAFAGTRFVGKINIPEGYTSIGDYAFSNSMIGSMTLPSTINFPGKEGVGLFEGCSVLTSIMVERKDFEVPAYFAKDCPVLNKVEFAAPPRNLRQSAFKGCRNLVDYPFDPYTYIQGDSIFADCGFKDVRFASGVYRGQLGGDHTHLFADCRYLETIDLSRIQFDGTNNPAIYDVNSGFATGCPSLQSVAFPAKTRFNGVSFDTPAISDVTIGSFEVVDEAPFTYSVAGFAAPSVYVVTQTVYPFQTTPLDRLFSAAANFSLEPVFYCDAFTPAFYSLLDKATYYIPANTRDRYPEGDAEVREMFSASIRRNGAAVTFESYPLLPQVKMSMVMFNDDRIVDIDRAGGREVIDYPFDEIETVIVYYKIAGNILATKYPAAVLLAASTGIEEVDGASTSLAITCTGRRVDLGIEADYTVVTPSGTVVATGRASSFTLDAPGLYIITATDGPHRSTAKLSIQ